MAKAKSPARERAVSILEKGLEEARKLTESEDITGAAKAMPENIDRANRRLRLYLSRGLIDQKTADKINRGYLEVEKKFYGDYNKTQPTLLNDIPNPARN